MTITLTFETTGEVRCPRRGEWFVGVGGKPVLSESDCAFAEHTILREVDKPPLDVPAAIAGLLDELRDSGTNAVADAMVNDHPRVVATAKMLANQCSGYIDAVEALVERNAKLRQVLTTLVTDIDDLICDSDGVYGLHLNGDVAPWGELTEGGRFEAWLGSLEEARRALQE